MPSHENGERGIETERKEKRVRILDAESGLDFLLLKRI